ncbi:MAG: hypothetical protein SGI97_00220 [candidate division Zixibacteria bacterium]|nr:hypothetical protein [candidate division Zixibacteria bacterium]
MGRIVFFAIIFGAGFFLGYFVGKSSHAVPPQLPPGDENKRWPTV